MSGIGGYEIVDRIGQGGMGTVYRARAADGTVVALKLLHLHLTTSEEYVRRFQREAKLAEKLAHPNVVRVLGSGEDGGQHYLAMEYVQGESLTERLERSGILAPGVKSSGRAGAEPPADGAPTQAGEAPPRSSACPPVCNLPVEEVIRLLRQVAGVLQAAADIGLVHRDLKPQNILLDASGNAKVLDFGLAKDTATQVSTLSLTGQSIGTPPYMSPEQCEGTREVDTRSDLYSLGATAYQMLTGRPPFPGPTATAYLRQHLEEIPTPVARLNPAIPLNLSQVVDRLLAKKPEDRHQTPAELIEDLNRVERGEVPLKLHRPKKARKHGLRFTLAVAAAAVLVCLAAVGAWLWQRGAGAESALEEAVSAAQFAADKGDLDGALAGLDDALARYRAVASDSSVSSVGAAPAEDLRQQLRQRKAAAEQARLDERTKRVAEGDVLLKELKYAEALAAYQQAKALGETAEITDKIATTDKWKKEADDKAAAAETARRADEQRRREEADAEAQRRRDYETALAAAKAHLAEGEDRLDEARAESARARDLARSKAEVDAAVALQDQVAEALKRRRPWVAVVDFTISPGVDAKVTGDAVADGIASSLPAGYRRVQRSHIEKALTELRFQASDLADRAKAQAFGKQTGAEYLISGRVTQVGRDLRVFAEMFRVDTGAVRQDADNTARSLDEMDTAFFAEIAQVLGMTAEEKALYLAEKRDYPKHLAAGNAAVARNDWIGAEKAFEQARRAKRTPEVEKLLAEAQAKAQEQRLQAERQAAHEAACGEGDRLLAEKRWAEAEAAFGRALQVEGFAVSAAAKAGVAAAKLGAAVKAAAEAQGRQDWQGVVDALGPVRSPGLSRSYEDRLKAELQTRDALLKEAAGHLEPTLTIAAELEGQPAPGARVTIDGSTQEKTTPATYKVESGKTYAISVTLPPAGGRFFTTAETTLTADWRGPRTWMAKLEVAKGPAQGQAWTVPELGMELAYVAPGSFQMGSNDGDSDEKPVHAVRISRGFWLGKYEVTQAEFEAIAGSNPSRFKGARNPVEQVSWKDAMAFCQKLTERERSAGRLPGGYEYRLPTEAEWEYAARGGSKSKGFTYSGSNTEDEVAWYTSNSGGRTHPVGQKKANELGLCDMPGNVWEWCLDWYDPGYYGRYGRSPNTDPANLQAAAGRVFRGGGWCYAPRSLRSAGRLGFRPVCAIGDLGFRASLAPRSEGQ
jgi:formylglycine-generating enzyme required for sulfatase activity/TolB-like protein